MTKITKITAHVLRRARPIMGEGQGHPFSATGRVVIVEVMDAEGFCGYGAFQAERSEDVITAYLRDHLFPLVIGHDANNREGIWQRIFDSDRHFGFYPLHTTGGIDVALWDLAAKRADLPLYQFIGATRSSLPAYYSSAFMDSDEEYVADVIAAKQRGFGAYKVHSKRISTFELAREVAGPDMTLFADPAADWTLEHAIRVGRALEDLDYRWFEEPFRDWNFTKYRKLTRALDIPVAATEALAGGPCGVAQAIVAGEIDIVRADPGWKMGITGTLKVAHLAEAFGLNCELHSGMNGVTDIVNIHLGCAIANTEWFELHVPDEILKFPMLNEYPIQDGVASPPSGPGLGIEIDWDSVDNDSSWFIEATA